MKTYPRNLDNDSQVIDVWKEIESKYCTGAIAPSCEDLKKLGVAVCLNAIDKSQAVVGDAMVKFHAYRVAHGDVPQELKGDVMNRYGDGDWFNLDAVLKVGPGGTSVDTTMYSGRSFDVLWSVWRSWVGVGDDVSQALKRIAE